MEHAILYIVLFFSSSLTNLLIKGSVRMPGTESQWCPHLRAKDTFGPLRGFGLLTGLLYGLLIEEIEYQLAEY